MYHIPIHFQTLVSLPSMEVILSREYVCHCLLLLIIKDIKGTINSDINGILGRKLHTKVMKSKFKCKIN